MISASPLPLSRPSLDEADIQAVLDVLRSGWITTGARVVALEAAFVYATRCTEAVAVSSATAAMHLAMHSLRLEPGDEVITPSMTWVSTANSIALCGATPVFADVNRDTLMSDPAHFEPLINARTKAIVPVHFAGATVDSCGFRALACKHGITSIEDGAHALGAYDRGYPVGSCGTTLFSLHAIKNVTTAEGGVLCTDDPLLAERIRRLRFHGLDLNAFDRDMGGRAPAAGVVEPGFKYNLPDLNATLALGQMDRLAQTTARRAELAAQYASALADVDEIRLLSIPARTTTHAWHLMVVRLDTQRARMSRKCFMQLLQAQGIGTGVHFRAVHQQPFYKARFTVPDERLPDTSWNSDRVLSLPLFPGMCDDDVERVVGAVKSVLAGRVQ